MALAVRFLPLRLSKSSSVKNTSVALELGTKPFTDMPVNSTAPETPGILRPISPIWRVTSSERSTVAAGGSWRDRDHILFVLVGTKPAGHGVEAKVSENDQARINHERDATTPHGVCDGACVARCRRQEAAVEAFEEPTEQACPSMRVSRSGFAPCGFSSTAARAGESVRELNAEITVEMAIVSANCR